MESRIKHWVRDQFDTHSDKHVPSKLFYGAAGVLAFMLIGICTWIAINQSNVRDDMRGLRDDVGRLDSKINDCDKRIYQYQNPYQPQNSITDTTTNRK